VLHRFISQDPLGFVGSGPNFYEYAFNSPINFADRSGLAPGDWWDPVTYKTLPTELNPFNPNGTFSQEAIAIGQSAHGIITGNWAQVAAAAPNTPLGMTEMYGRSCDKFSKYVGYYGVRGALIGASVADILAGTLIAKGLIEDILGKTGPSGPKPPGWNENWEWRYPEGNGSSSPRWFDESGGEWRYHGVDSWHSTPHWDFNPWTEWNSAWQNIRIP